MRNKREKGPKNGVIGSPTKLAGRSSKDLTKKAGLSPSKISKKTETVLSKDGKKLKVKGETSFIIEELMS